MEPLFFKAENRLGDKFRLLCFKRFNGAAFFQSGKLLLVGQLPDRHNASMEPLFFKAENTYHPISSTGPMAASMEPLFFKAENAGIACEGCRHGVASMEPLFFKAENTPIRAPATPLAALQWSRFFSKRKTWEQYRPVIAWRSFNGAAFFQSGKRPRRLRANRGSRASMEPLFFKAVNLQLLTQKRQPARSFNGAAFFQSGKQACPRRLLIHLR